MASLWYTASGILERGIAFLFTPVFTRILTPEEYGLYPLYVSWMGLFTVLITLELSGSVIYRGLTRFIGREKEFIRSASDIILTVGVIALAQSYLFSGATERLTGMNAAITRILIIQISANGIINLYLAKCRHRYNYRTPSIINLTFALLSPTLAVLLINFTRVRAEGRIAAQLAVSVAIALPLLVSIYRSKSGGREMKRYILRLAMPLLPHFVSTTIIAQCGKIIIGHYYGESDVAKYSVAFSVGFLLSMLTGGIYSALSPWIMRKMSHGYEDKINSTVTSLFSMLAVLSLLIPALAPEIMSVLAPSEYGEAVTAVYPVCLSVLITFLSNIFSSIIMYYEKSKLIAISSVAVAALSLSLNLLLTSRYGYVFAAIIQVISSLLILMFYAFILGGVLKKQVISLIPLARILLTSSWYYLLLYLLRDVLISRLLLLPVIVLLVIPRARACRKLLRESKNPEC